MPAVFPISNIDPIEAGKGQRTFIPGRNTSLFWDLKCIITCPPGRVPRTCWINPHSMHGGGLKENENHSTYRSGRTGEKDTASPEESAPVGAGQQHHLSQCWITGRYHSGNVDAWLRLLVARGAAVHTRSCWICLCSYFSNDTAWDVCHVGS